MAQVTLDYTLKETRKMYIVLGSDYTCILLSILFECELFLILLTDRDGKECIPQISDHIMRAAGCIFCSSIDTVSDTEAEIWASTWFSSWIYLIFVGARLLN